MNPIWISVAVATVLHCERPREVPAPILRERQPWKRSAGGCLRAPRLALKDVIERVRRRMARPRRTQ